jgi:putative ABC transport system substrate-binding protein
MRRRDFIAALGGTAAAPMLESLTARAQQGMPVVGFLRSESLANVTHQVAGFRQGLKEAGFVESQNVTVEYRSAEGQADRLRVLVAELARRPVAVIVGNNAAALAAQAATKTVPIVFASGGDPVRDGLVASLSRPGGNITGVSFLGGTLGAKRLDLLRQFVPKASRIAVLTHPNTPEGVRETRDVQVAAESMGQTLNVVEVNSERDFESAFATLVQRGVDALFSGTGAFLFANRQRVIALAARHAIPAIYSVRENVAEGGLMSYGASQGDAYRQVGLYAGRILKGEKPGDLPVVQATKLEFVINLKTAKTLGLEFHPQLLGLADEVIE